MADYKYKVTGPRGGQYLTTTKKEAEALTKGGGKIRKIQTAPKRRSKTRRKNPAGCVAPRRVVGLFNEGRVPVEVLRQMFPDWYDSKGRQVGGYVRVMANLGAVNEKGKPIKSVLAVPFQAKVEIAKTWRSVSKFWGYQKKESFKEVKKALTISAYIAIMEMCAEGTAHPFTKGGTVFLQRLEPYLNPPIRNPKRSTKYSCERCGSPALPEGIHCKECAIGVADGLLGSKAWMDVRGNTLVEPGGAKFRKPGWTLANEIRSERDALKHRNGLTSGPGRGEWEDWQVNYTDGYGSPYNSYSFEVEMPNTDRYYDIYYDEQAKKWSGEWVLSLIDYYSHKEAELSRHKTAAAARAAALKHWREKKGRMPPRRKRNPGGAKQRARGVRKWSSPGVDYRDYAERQRRAVGSGPYARHMRDAQKARKDAKVFLRDDYRRGLEGAKGRHAAALRGARSSRNPGHDWAGQGIDFGHKYLNTFFSEKGLPIKTWTVKAPNGTPHIINSQVVLEHVAMAAKDEKDEISRVIRKIDFANGDVNHFLKHLAGAIAANYSSDIF